MSQPVIVADHQAEMKELPPPARERTRPHKWLTDKRLEEYRLMEKAGLELYVSKLAEEKIRNHALVHMNERKEVMGLLLGGRYRHNGAEYALVRDVATTDLDATDVSVRFDPRAFEKLFASLEEIGFRYVIVGWYHSHPSYHCFMPFEKIDRMSADHLAAMGSIREWIEVSTLDRTCRENGLGGMIDLGRRKMLPPADLVGAYEKRFYRSWLDQAISEDPHLRDFRSDEHTQAIALFRRLDERQMDTAQRRLRNLLNARREWALNPLVAVPGELNTLRHEAAKKKRFKQIRQLFHEDQGDVRKLRIGRNLPP